MCSRWISDDSRDELANSVMQVMESSCGDIDFEEEKKGRDNMDFFPIEQVECFMMETESVIRILVLHDQQYLHDGRQEGAFFMTGVTRDESKDCAEPKAELSMHNSEEHALNSKEGTTTLTAACGEMVSIHSESASQVVISLTAVKTPDEDWNRSPRSVLMMGNSALERSRLKRCMAARDSLKIEKSDIIDKAKQIGVGVGSHISALPLPPPEPVLIPHSRRRRTSAVIIQNCIRIFLLHCRVINKRIQGEMSKCSNFTPSSHNSSLSQFLIILFSPSPFPSYSHELYLSGLAQQDLLSFFSISSIVAIY